MSSKGRRVGNLVSNVGVSTIATELDITNGPVVIGTATSTGTASQPLQVTGGAYVSGNLGIGTTNPTFPLNIHSNVTAGITIKRTTGTGGNFIQLQNGGGNYYIGPDNSTGTVGFSQNFGGTPYGLVLVTESAYPITMGTNNIERIRINANGDVGIGTTGASISGARVLSVGGQSLYGYLFLKDTSDQNSIQLYTSASQNELDSQKQLSIRTEAGDLLFKTANIERARITSSGSVGIGTANPASKLDVDGEITIRRTAAGNEGGQINFARASDNAVAWNIDAYGSTSTPSLRFIDAIAPASRMEIDGSGRVTMPHQPCFQAYQVSNVAVSAGLTTLSYTGETFDVGGNYNTSNYRFTAPVAGKYLFTMTVNLYQNPGAWHCLIRVNGNTSYIGNRMASNITGDNNVVSTAILSLNANDYVEPMVNSANGGDRSGGATWNRFEGYLIG